MRRAGTRATLIAGLTWLSLAPVAHAAAHPSPIASRARVPLGAALWYACTDPAYGGPAALDCPVKPVAPQTAASLAASYSSTFTASFDRLTPENEFKMAWTEPSQGQFDFSVADKAAAFAQARGKHVHGHALVYAAANPGWVDKPFFLFPWTRNSLLAAMRNHITTEVTHFKSAFPGVVDEWDVVNEPFLDSGGRDQNVYQRVIGDDWIEQAFRAANAADPDALLYLNEFNADTTGPRQQAVLALVKDFLARGVPIDGVGLETHLGAGGSYPKLDELESVMASYAQLGLRVALTELDVLRPVTWDGGIAQRAAYDTAAQACREMPNCTAVTVWGVADAYSWRSADQRATLFDASLAAKPSYADVRCRLADPKPATGAWTPAPCGPTPPATGPTQTTGPTGGSSIASNQPPPAGAALAPIAPMPPVPPATAPPPPPPARVDVTPPVVTIRASRSQRVGKAIAVTVSCRYEACRAVIGAAASVRRARGARPRTYALTTVKRAIAKGHALQARLRLTAGARAAIRRALRNDQHVIVTLEITVADAAGNARVHRRRIALRL